MALTATTTQSRERALMLVLDLQLTGIGILGKLGNLSGYGFIILKIRWLDLMTSNSF